MRTSVSMPVKRSAGAAPLAPAPLVAMLVVAVTSAVRSGRRRGRQRDEDGPHVGAEPPVAMTLAGGVVDEEHLARAEVPDFAVADLDLHLPCQPHDELGLGVGMPD